MFKRLPKCPSKKEVPGPPEKQTREPVPDPGKKLNGRWAGIIGASFIVAVGVGILTYLADGTSGASSAKAILAGSWAFGFTLNLLNSIIA